MRPLSPETLSLIEEFSEICRNAAKATMNASIDFDEKSILKIDELISQGWPAGQVNEKTIQVWGSFLGQAMCQVLNGTWVETEADLGIAVGNNVAHPFAKVEKRFLQGETESVSQFYLAFKGMQPQRKSKWWPF
ncbi:MAG TPA: hypothetical protein VFF03_01985 [Rhodocyclaceae bacterium]|nr:hypothetical protein [Rhodocyclaceae bacterium]